MRLFLYYFITNGLTFYASSSTIIPTPPLLTTNSHYFYTNSSSFLESTNVTYHISSYGPYTHYVDNSNPNSTDINNTYGTPALPRKTIPSTAAEGSVIELHGGPYGGKNIFSGGLVGKMGIIAQGSAARPVYLRGFSSVNKTLFTNTLYIAGTGLVIENIETYKCGFSLRHDLAGSNISDILIRHCELHGDGNEKINASAIAIGTWGLQTPGIMVSNVTISSNFIYNFGYSDSTNEYDYAGITVSGYDCYNFWILNNTISNLSSCGVRVGNNEGWSIPYNSKYAFISSNHFYKLGENAVATKQFDNVIASQNFASGFAKTLHNSGAAFNVLYNPYNIWYLNNIIENAEIGIKCSGVSDFYAIGNIIKSCNYGVSYWSIGDIYIINNTLYDIKTIGIYNYSGMVVTNDRPIINNIIFMDNAVNTNYHFHINNAGTASYSRMDHNLFFQNSGSFNARWQGTVCTSFSDWLKLPVNSSKGDGTILTNPFFANPNMMPALTSKVIRAGVNMNIYSDKLTSRFGTLYDRDVYNTPRYHNGTWTIGAVELPNILPPSNVIFK